MSISVNLLILSLSLLFIIVNVVYAVVEIVMSHLYVEMEQLTTVIVIKLKICFAHCFFKLRNARHKRLSFR